MGKILAIDYGLKRTGLAITDDLQIIGSPHSTVDTSELWAVLDVLILKERIECMVVGDARHLDGNASDTTVAIDAFVTQLAKRFPSLPIERVNEMFTSRMAEQALRTGGMRQSQRRLKGNVDKVAAAIMLQYFLDSRQRNSGR